MRWLLVAVLLVHGAIHVMGVAKAFGWADLPQLTQPISRAMGIAWLVAALLLITTAVLVVTGSRLWWALGAAAVLCSQVVIVSAWSDARFGTIANVFVAAAVVHGFASLGPLSLRAAYEREVRARSTPAVASMQVVTEADLASLPEPVRRYLRVVGALGQPRVHHVRATLRGRIRGSPEEPWMEFTAEQHNFLDEPARFFFMNATRTGFPVDVFHAFEADAASMRVRLLSLVPLVEASGPELTRAETVTLLNDLCFLAPAALIDPAIHWEAIDDRSARARYTVGPNTITAVLWFNDAGELADFTSDDRLAQSAGGAEWTRQAWSTPLSTYRQFGPWRLAARGEGRWHRESGEFVYIEMELLDVQTHPRPSP